MKNEQCTTEISTAYKIDRDLSDAGVECAIYFGKAYTGPHVWQLLAKQEQIMKFFEKSLLELWEEIIGRGQADVATELKIIDKIELFEYVLHCFDLVFWLLKEKSSS
eukprot:15356452-Ditylum_brightwellii.AAC.1